MPYYYMWVDYKACFGNLTFELPNTWDNIEGKLIIICIEHVTEPETATDVCGMIASLQLGLHSSNHICMDET